MDSAFEKALSEALEAQEIGRPIDEILAGYPDEADRLRPILEMTLAMSSLRVAHSIGAQAQSLNQFLGAAKAMQSNKAGAAGPAAILLRRFATALSMVVLILFLLSAAITISAQSAVPGDALYSTKRTIEEIRVSLVRDPESLDRLTERFNQDRIEEIKKLAARERNASDLEFFGKVESSSSGTIVVAGISIDIREITASAGLPEIGDLVMVFVDLQGGNVVATKVVILSRSEEAPESLPEITITPQREEDIQPEPTRVPDINPEPTARVTRTPLVLPTTDNPGDILPVGMTPTLKSDIDDSGENEVDDDADDVGNEEEDSSNSGDGGDGGSDPGEDEEETEDESKAKVIGIVEAIGVESWTISGQVVGITHDTKIEDSIAEGDEVEVEATINDDGSWVALEIALINDDGLDESDADGSDNSDEGNLDGSDHHGSGESDDGDPDDSDDEGSDDSDDDDDDDKPDRGD